MFDLKTSGLAVGLVIVGIVLTLLILLFLAGCGERALLIHDDGTVEIVVEEDDEKTQIVSDGNLDSAVTRESD